MERFDIIIKTFHGLEELLLNELQEFGINENEILTRAVKSKVNQKELYLLNLASGLAVSILKPLREFEAKDEEHLYKAVYDIDWASLFNVNQTFAISAQCSGEIFTHSHFVALKSKDAIADRFRKEFGKRPNIDRQNPDILVNVHIRDNIVTLSLDSSGTTLDRRGYRTEHVEAPINEILAHALLRFSGYDGSQALIDPMCGSGTIPIEAALISAKIAPGIRRNFTFQNWPDFDRDLFDELRTGLMNREQKAHAKIEGFDASQKAVKIAIRNARRAGVDRITRFKKRDFFELKEVEENSILIMNPPYDERLSVDNIGGLYEEIGSHLKHHGRGAKAFIFSGNVEAMKYVGLKPFLKKTLYNGSILSKYHGFDLY